MDKKLQHFIKKRSHLIWYVKRPEGISEESLVEHTLSNGDWNDVKELIQALGTAKVAAIFRKQLEGKRTNYDKKVRHFFTLYFNHYAP